MKQQLEEQKMAVSIKNSKIFQTIRLRLPSRWIKNDIQSIVVKASQRPQMDERAQSALYRELKRSEVLPYYQFKMS